LYLGQTSISSTYGAAGSLGVLQIWFYYCAQIFFFGAELTYIYANRLGSKTVPVSNAMRVSKWEDLRTEPMATSR
jgi:membrane protein